MVQTSEYALDPMPAVFRGNALESHSSGPIKWEAPDEATAVRVAVRVRRRLTLGGLQSRFWVTCVGKFVRVERA